MVEHVSNLPDFQSIINGSGQKLVVVDFTATWCGPCRAIAPHFEELARRYTGRARFIKVDVDEAQDVARHCSVSSMPTFHFYRSGKFVSQFSGADPNRLDSTIEQFAPSSADVSFAGSGQRLGAPSSAGNQAAGSMREAAAQAAARRAEMLAKQAAEATKAEADKKDDENKEKESNPDATDKQDEKSTPTADSANNAEPKNDVRLKVNQSLVKQMVDEMGFPRVRSEKALILTGNKSLEDAVEWCFEHADDADVDEPLQIVTENGDVKPSPDPNRPKLSREEVKRRADELFSKARAKREASEKKDALERERARVKSGKEAAITKAKLEEAERKRAVEARRRQKREDMEERQRVRQMLQADKEARRRKFNMPGAAPDPQPQQPQQPKPVQPKAPVDGGRIQFRFPDGSRMEGEFKSEQTIQDVITFITSSKPELAARSLNFSQQYPRKIFSQADYSTSLSALNLLPRGALIVSFS